jgi:hypothetical protein
VDTNILEEPAASIFRVEVSQVGRGGGTGSKSTGLASWVQGWGKGDEALGKLMGTGSPEKSNYERKSLKMVTTKGHF